jgi:hypothetical protein
MKERGPCDLDQTSGKRDSKKSLTRRSLLRKAGTTAAGGAAGAILGTSLASAQTGATHMNHGGGATFRLGGTVDYAANGLDPTVFLRQFDWGRTSRLPNGQTLREWDISALDREIEVAPGASFPA